MKPIIALLLAVLVLAACDTNTAALPEETLGTLSIETQGYFGIPQADTSDVFPSTNAENAALGWANVRINGDDAVQVGSVELLFAGPRPFWSCFEYRADEEANTVAGDNPNPGVLDGRWTQVCLNDNTSLLTLEAEVFIDVRSAYGAETDERFDWNRFWVLTPLTKDDCKNGAWQDLGYRNQGQCIAAIVANANSRH